MMTSRPSSIFGSGTLSQRISFVPCQQSAFMEWALVISNEVENGRAGREKFALPLRAVAWDAASVQAHATIDASGLDATSHKI